MGNFVRSAVAVVLCFAVMACDGQDGTNGSSCTVVDNHDGTATVSCSDGSTFTVHNGVNGQDGTNGSSCTVVDNHDGTATISCPDGTEVTVGTPTCYRTFRDVPCEAWFFYSVEQLVDDGIIDVADYYRPNDPVNRAEFVKFVITAIDGLASYTAPATPTFTDVQPSAWYYDYIEAGVQLGIVTGYTDASGNLTGEFGPGDTMSRAHAIKILVNAFAIPTTLSPASPFTDVTPEQWFHNYVVTAYNQSVVDGSADGLFHPSDPLTRAYMAQWLVKARNPTPRN